mmetsp:Transcript_56032/g.109678  ORF Transcript_56032/g.109678 Transcript_56032/m.109678 type:complete len:116 (+) Transcript_56032:129-476(+)
MFSKQGDAQKLASFFQAGPMDVGHAHGAHSHSHGHEHEHGHNGHGHSVSLICSPSLLVSLDSLAVPDVQTSWVLVRKLGDISPSCLDYVRDAEGRKQTTLPSSKNLPQPSPVSRL